MDASIDTLTGSRLDFIRGIISFPETEKIDRLADTYYTGNHDSDGGRET
jgi:hypothetical protein